MPLGGAYVSRLTDLIGRAKKKDAQLGADLEREFKALSERRAFGLNFERHSPETVELPSRPVRKGDKVRILPDRRSTAKGDQRLWVVKSVAKGVARILLADGNNGDEGEPDLRELATGDLVVVAEFRDFIYPGMVSTGKVERGDDKPFHIVINAENYHALRALTYTHRGAIDVIYIDPPYNTRDKDWKYNNDYVDSDDYYRHSKWLAMMERRLVVARDLLNPSNSVLIVTIDEKEYLRLGLLLEQLFPEARMQMISSVINPKGATRSSAFGRTDEYIFFVMFGSAAPAPVQLGSEWKIKEDRRAGTLRWAELLRSGSNTRRADSPNQFYPVYVRNGPAGPEFASVGDAYFGDEWRGLEAPTGCVAVWPIRSDGTEGNWQNSAANLRDLIRKGYAKLGKWRGSSTAITYLKRGEQRKVENGVFPVVGRRQDNSIIVNDAEYRPVFIPGTQWRIASHNAEQGGTNLQKCLIPDRKFPFPKSLYAVEDTIRFFVTDKPNATILDFFSGSGTTAHAVMRLNKQDNGRRQSISVTNNEVAAGEQIALRKEGFRPGDSEWERLGIADYITKPRIAAAITGQTPDRKRIEGDYKFTDEFPMADGFEENAEFFTLTYETPIAVDHGRAFAKIAPLLWMRAGSQGSRIETLPEGGWAVAQTYGLLADLDQAESFLEAVAGEPALRVAFIVTNDNKRFEAVAQVLAQSHEEVEAVRLYESYLTNFRFTSGGEA